MRSCEEYELLVSAFLDGDLSGTDREELAEHLTACPRCQQYFDDLVAMHDAFDQEEPPLPEGFGERVMSRVRETPQEEKRKIIPFSRWRRWAAFAACCAVIAAGVWRVWMPDSSTASQTAVFSSAPDMADSWTPAAYGGKNDAPAAHMDGAAVSEEAGLPEEAPAEKSALIDQAAPENAEDYTTGSRPSLAAAPKIQSGSVTAAGSATQAWVEEVLGQEWETGRTYSLTLEQYASLLDALASAGEDFQVEPGEECLLLAA